MWYSVTCKHAAWDTISQLFTPGVPSRDDVMKQCPSRTALQCASQITQPGVTNQICCR
jgi:hypothetical protein